MQGAAGPCHDSAVKHFLSFSYRPQALVPRLAASLLAAAVLAGCSTSRTVGGGESDLAMSSDAQLARDAKDGGLARCESRLGQIAITEAEGNSQALTSAGLPRTMAPLVRHLLTRTQCFGVVDRGAAFTLLEQERKLREQLGLENNQPAKHLQTVDYVLRAEIVFAEQVDGSKGLLGGVFSGGIVGMGGEYNKKEAVVLLSVVDARTSEIVSSVFGRGTSESAGLGSLVLASGVVLVDGGWADTPQAKTVAAALVDAWNRTQPKLVSDIAASRAAAAKEAAAREAAAKEAAARAAAEKLAAEKEAQRAAAEKAAAERAAAERATAERLAAEKLAQEKLAEAKAAQEKEAQRAAAEKAAADKQAAEQAAADKQAAEKEAAQKAAAEKAAAEKAAADKEAARKADVEKAESRNAEAPNPQAPPPPPDATGAQAPQAEGASEPGTVSP